MTTSGRHQYEFTIRLIVGVLYNVCDDPTPEAMEAYLTVHSSP